MMDTNFAVNVCKSLYAKHPGLIIRDIKFTEDIQCIYISVAFAFWEKGIEHQIATCTADRSATFPEIVSVISETLSKFFK